VGLPQIPLNTNVTVNGTVSEPVTICDGQKPGDVIFLTTMNGSPYFDDSQKTTTMVTGAYCIQTDNSFTFPNENNIFLGLGCSDPEDSSAGIPTAVITAAPGNLYTI